MQWANDEPKRGKRPLEDKSTIPLEVHIRKERTRIEAFKEKIPPLEKELENLKHSLPTLTARWQVRIRNETTEKIQSIEEELTCIKNDEYMKDFERKIEPYTKAHVNQKHMDMVRSKHKKGRNSSIPGDSHCGIDAFISKETSHGSEIIAEYLSDVHGEAPKIVLEQKDTCPMCQNTMLLISTKSLMSCQQCGYSSTYLDATTSSVSYGDEVEFASFSYKRLNHFNEWLQQIQAKESAEIPNEIIYKVMEELQNQRVKLKDITSAKIREVLKTLKLRKTYEHVAQIKMRITGQTPPRMTADMEELCRLCFIAVQPAFEKHCPPDRKNFLSYSYCLYKFFQLLGYDEFLDSFTLLKGRDKLTKQDEIFKKICDELDWTFLPSV
jgi:ribosomal protein S27AE